MSPDSSRLHALVVRKEKVVLSLAIILLDTHEDLIIWMSLSKGQEYKSVPINTFPIFRSEGLHKNIVSVELWGSIFKEVQLLLLLHEPITCSNKRQLALRSLNFHREFLTLRIPNLIDLAQFQEIPVLVHLLGLGGICKKVPVGELHTCLHQS